MQLDSRRIKILQEMGVPVSGFALRKKNATLARNEISIKNDFSTNDTKAQPIEVNLKPPATSKSISSSTPKGIVRDKAVTPEFPPINSSLLKTLDWESLKSENSTCQSCALSKTRNRVVWGSQLEESSSKSAPPKELSLTQNLDWLIIDHSPSDLEDQTANPLASESGQLLQNMLKALRLQDQMSISTTTASQSAQTITRKMGLTNAVKCHPPGGRNPDEFETRQCKPFIQRQIELLRPKAILVLGLAAYKAVFSEQFSGETSLGAPAKTPPLTQLRGEVLRLFDIPTFVTYHPGSLLLHPQDKAKVWQDLSRAHAFLIKNEGISMPVV